MRHCGDCGGDIGEQKKSSRRDVCDECWDRRGWLMDNYALIGLDAFQKVQRAMRGRRGTAKRAILKLQQGA